MKDIAIIRSMSTKEGDHGRATFNLRTGYQQTGPIRYPTLGSLVAKELGRDDAELPNFVSIAPVRSFNPGAFGPGFLGPQYAPLVVGERAVLDPQAATDARSLSFKVEDLDLPPGVDNRRADARLGLLDSFRNDFMSSHPGDRPGKPPGRLPAGRPVDAGRRRPRRLTWKKSRPRSATPTAGPRSARDACWHGGWSSAACRSSRSRCPPPAEQTRLGLGHSPAELRVGEEAERGARPGLGRR